MDPAKLGNNQNTVLLREKTSHRTCIHTPYPQMALEEKYAICFQSCWLKGPVQPPLSLCSAKKMESSIYCTKSVSSTSQKKRKTEKISIFCLLLLSYRCIKRVICFEQEQPIRKWRGWDDIHLLSKWMRSVWCTRGMKQRATFLIIFWSQMLLY